MAKINYNGNKIINSIQPAITNSINYINNAISLAERVNFPSGEFDFGNIKTDLNDCLDDSKKYLNWISNVNKKFETTFINNEVAIQEIKIKSVKQRKSIVK